MVRRVVPCNDFGIVVLYFPIRGFAVESVGNETSGRMVCSGLLDLCRSDGGIDFARGGFQRSYEKRNTCATPTFTVFGTLCYEFVKESMPITPEIHSEIERWLSAASRSYPVSGVEHKRHCVVILAESFEGGCWNGM